MLFPVLFYRWHPISHLMNLQTMKGFSLTKGFAQRYKHTKLKCISSKVAIGKCGFESVRGPGD